MTLKQITKKVEWDNFVSRQKEQSFLHSWAWGEFNKSIDDKIWRLGIYNDDSLAAVALVIKVHARRGNFLFVPHGPIIDGSDIISNFKSQILNELLNKLKEIAKQEKDIVFIRISPLLKESGENKKMFKDLGFRDAPIYMHAETTWVLPLDKNEKQLLMGMRKNTRNLIRRAEREGIETVSGNSYDLIDIFMKMYRDTAKKHSFVPFSERYINGEINSFSVDENGYAKVYLAKYGQEYIAGAVIVFWGNSAYYHHGASSSLHSKIPASYLLQWQVIKDAKSAGKKFYNFWGITKDENNKKNPWYGLTLFKKGFGGERTDYLHAQDLPLNKRYWLNFVLEKYRLWRRGV